MRIIQITTDNREHFKEYEKATPYFGTAPQGLFDGFTEFPDAEIHVISCTKHPMNAPEKIAPNIHFHQPLISPMGWGKTLFSGTIRAVRKLVKQIDPDIVHGQGTERDCAIAAVLSGRPNVITIHGNMRVHAKRLEHNHQLYYKLAAALEGFCLRKTDGVVAISRYTEDLVKPLCARTWLLPNAVDRRFFNITPVPPEIPRFLVVGSIGHRKNPIGLIETCEDMLSAGRCTIAFAGDGERGSDYYRAFEQKLKTVPNLELLGFLDRNELAAEFARSTAVILPTFEDNCPMVVLEGMAAGLPVAASRVGGVPDLIEHDVDGLMFDPHRPADMKSVIEALATDCGLRQRLGARARETATHRFHPRVIAGEHLRIYREVLSAS